MVSICLILDPEAYSTAPTGRRPTKFNPTVSAPLLVHNPAAVECLRCLITRSTQSLKCRRSITDERAEPTISAYIVVNVLNGPDGAWAQDGNQSPTRMRQRSWRDPTSDPVRTDPTAAEGWEIWSERVITLVDESEPVLSRQRYARRRTDSDGRSGSLNSHHGQSSKNESLGVGGLRASERLSCIRVQEEQCE